MPEYWWWETWRALLWKSWAEPVDVKAPLLTLPLYSLLSDYMYRQDSIKEYFIFCRSLTFLARLFLLSWELYLLYPRGPLKASSGKFTVKTQTTDRCFGRSTNCFWVLSEPPITGKHHRKVANQSAGPGSAPGHGNINWKQLYDAAEESVFVIISRCFHHVVGTYHRQYAMLKIYVIFAICLSFSSISIEFHAIYHRFLTCWGSEPEMSWLSGDLQDSKTKKNPPHFCNNMFFSSLFSHFCVFYCELVKSTL